MNHYIKIYKQEKDAGLVQLIKANASIAYVTQLMPLKLETPLANKVIKAFASNEHPVETLYPLVDVLVTTGWNLNTDVFDIPEAWVARYTPEDHPLNFQHDEKRIIGHIKTSTAVASLDTMEPLPDDLSIDELPSKFHIVNSSVLYRVWQDEEQEKLMNQTIAEIEKGEWYVSMECIFKGFDYAVVRPDGSSGIIPRNEESSFLTKHLRQYGGTGIYKDERTGAEFKLGRVLRNINFIGKGLVRKPANPESIILNNVSTFAGTFCSLGYIKSEAEIIPKNQPEKDDMSEVNSDIKRLEDRVADLLKQNEALATQLKERDGQAVRAELDVLRNEIAVRDKKIEVLDAKVAELTSSMTSLQSRAEQDESVRSMLETELNQLKAEKVEAARLALLTGKGATTEKAAELVKKFSRFTDEEFNDIIETLSAAWKQSTTSPRKPEQVIANVRPEVDAALNVSEPSEQDKSEVRIQKLSKVMAGFLRYNNVPTATGQDKD